MRRTELDVLRSLAIVGVIVLHNLYDWDPLTQSTALRLWGLSGWSVLTFFLLSGLLSRPNLLAPLALRLERSADLLLAWLLWGVLYTLLGVLSLTLHLVPAIPNLFSTTYPFFDFAYQLYFLVVLAAFQTLQAIWLFLAHRLSWSVRLQAALELLLAVTLLAFTFRSGWPEVPHGSFPSLYPLYGLAYLAGVLQARSFHLSFALSGITALAALMVGSIPGTAWFLILAPPLIPLLGQLLRCVPQWFLAPIVLLSASSGAIFLLHHPLLLPLSRRFWRVVGLPDFINYFLCIIMACLLPILLVQLLRPWLLRWPRLARLLLVQPRIFQIETR